MKKAHFNIHQIHYWTLGQTFQFFDVSWCYQAIAYTYFNNWEGINRLNASSSACHILHFLWSRLATFQVSYKASIFFQLLSHHYMHLFKFTIIE